MYPRRIEEVRPMQFCTIPHGNSQTVMLVIAGYLAFVVCPAQLAWTQGHQRSLETGNNAKLIVRGRYIVEGIAGCGYCHTPRDKDGNIDQTKWLGGAPVFYEPAQRVSGWAITAPRLAGLPPGDDAAFVKLMTTSIGRSGQPPRQPMPRFRMTREDAEAVLAYLKSLSPKQ
jgi:mono/diheme cytochrome c family protein